MTPFKPPVNDEKQRKGIRVRYFICTDYLLYCLDIAFYSHISIDRRKYDNMIIFWCIYYIYICIYIYMDISTNSYLHAYITYNLRAMTWFKIASLHLVIPC